MRVLLSLFAALGVVALVVGANAALRIADALDSIVDLKKRGR